MSDTFPPGITPDDAAALDALAVAGVGEGDFDGHDHSVDPELLFLYECNELAGLSDEDKAALRELAGDTVPRDAEGNVLLERVTDDPTVTDDEDTR